MIQQGSHQGASQHRPNVFLPPTVLGLMASYLNLQDLCPLRLVSKNFNKAITNHTTIPTINIKEKQTSDWDSLQKCLKSFKSAGCTTLSVDFIPTTHFVAFFPKLQNLQVSVSNSSSMDATHRCPEDFGDVFGLVPNLKSLKMGGLVLDHSFWSPLASSCFALSSLHLQLCHVSEEHLAKALPSLPNLEQLRVQSMDFLSPVLLTSLAKHGSNLKEVFCFFNELRFQEGTSVVQIPEPKPQLSLRKLELIPRMHISGQTTAGCLPDFLQLCPNLAFLNTYFSAPELSTIYSSPMIFENLTTLYLYLFGAHPGHFADLFQGITSKFPTISNLRFSGHSVIVKGTDLHLLSSVVGKQLKELDLGGLHSVECPLSAFVDVINKCPVLRKFCTPEMADWDDDYCTGLWEESERLKGKLEIPENMVFQFGNSCRQVGGEPRRCKDTLVLSLLNLFSSHPVRLSIGKVLPSLTATSMAKFSTFKFHERFGLRQFPFDLTSMTNLHEIPVDHDHVFCTENLGCQSLDQALVFIFKRPKWDIRSFIFCESALENMDVGIVEYLPVAQSQQDAYAVSVAHFLADFFPKDYHSNPLFWFSFTSKVLTDHPFILADFFPRDCEISVSAQVNQNLKVLISSVQEELQTKKVMEDLMARAVQRFFLRQ